MKSFATVALVAAFIFFLTSFVISRNLEKTVSPKAEEKIQASVTPINVESPAISQDELLKKIKNLFFEANPDIEFGITVYDLKTNVSFGYNDQEAQHAASVAKVLTAIYLLRQVEDEKIELRDSMGTYNVEFNLKQMVNQSNTISWEMIDERLGIEPQNNYAHSLGLESVNFRDNMMSPKDAARLFVKLYKGELLDEPYQRKLFSYMQNTETENLITPAIPKDIPLYHKTGLYEGEVHDVAIVDHSTRPFVLSIFSVNKLMPDYDGRAALIQKVAAEVYAYFTK
ncbi:MAG: serine hydrolase [bacterium]|nr:serine hydrolase [bacterium]